MFLCEKFQILLITHHGRFFKQYVLIGQTLPSHFPSQFFRPEYTEEDAHEESIEDEQLDEQIEGEIVVLCSINLSILSQIF